MNSLLSKSCFVIANVFLSLAHDHRFIDKWHDTLEPIGYKFQDWGYNFLRGRL